MSAAANGCVGMSSAKSGSGRERHGPRGAVSSRLHSAAQASSTEADIALEDGKDQGNVEHGHVSREQRARSGNVIEANEASDPQSQEDCDGKCAEFACDCSEG